MKNKLLLFALIFLFSFMFFDLTYADPLPVNKDISVLEDIQLKFKEIMEKTGGTIKKYAIRLFFILAGIGFVAKFITDIMQKGDIDSKEVISYIVKFILTTGFFYFLLDNGIKFSEDIISSMTIIGIEAGTGEKPTISGLINSGFTIFGLLKFNLTDLGFTLIIFVLALINLLFLVMMGVNLIIEQVSALILIYTGSFVLALGGMDYTRESAINFFKAVFASGLRIFALLIIISISIGIVGDSAKFSDKELKGLSAIYELLILLASTMILALISLKIPDALANLVSSAWGNMGGLTLISAVNMASNASSAIGGALSKVVSTSTGTIGAAANQAGKFATGIKDVMKNREIAAQKQSALDAGDMTAKINPLFNKRKNSSGASYQMGKLSASTALLAGKGVGKLSSIFGNSKEMTDVTSNVSDKSEFGNKSPFGKDNSTINNNSSTNINNNSNNPINSEMQNNSSQNNTNNISDNKLKTDQNTDTPNNKNGDDFQKNNGEVKNASESKIDNGGNNNV